VTTGEYPLLYVFVFLVEGKLREERIKRDAAVDVVHGAGFGKTFSSFIFAIVIVMVWTLRARVYTTTTIYSITT
jgi:hypothetical protein